MESSLSDLCAQLFGEILIDLLIVPVLLPLLLLSIEAAHSSRGVDDHLIISSLPLDLKLLEVIIVLKKFVGITLVVLLGVLLLINDGLSHLSLGVLGGALGVRWGQVLSRLL